MNRWFPIETERLLLREFRAGDESHIHEYASDPEVVRLMIWGPNLDRRELDLRDRPRAAGLHIFDVQHAALRPADEAAALRVRHLRQRAVPRDRGFDFHGALEPPGSALALRGDLDRVRLPGVIRRDAAHGSV